MKAGMSSGVLGLSKRGRKIVGGAGAAVVAAGIIHHRNNSSGKAQQQNVADVLTNYDDTRKYRQDPAYPAFRDMMLRNQ